MIERSAGGTTITGDDIMWFRNRQIARGLALEINTGLRAGKRGQSLVAIANRVSGGTGRTKRRALADLVAGWDDVPPSVVQALSN